MFNKVFERANNFIYRNARPLDFALWRYHFENGSKEDVLTALSAYQNEDGGFANAIEADCWNINSNPVSTWAAIGKLNQIGFTDKSHPIIAGILRYLDSGKDFAEGKWYNVIKSNNDYPHAVWWSCAEGEGVVSDNPTVSLAGFAFKYSDKNSKLYKKSVDIITLAVNRFIEKPSTEMHELYCYMELYEYCLSVNADIVDLEAFKAALYGAIRSAVCCDYEKWVTKYVCKPSSFFDISNLIFDILGRSICEKEAELIISAQQGDGSFPVTWVWHNDYKEFEIAANWWKSTIIINNLLYLKALNK